MKTKSVLLAISFATLLLFGTSLFAQQDADPSWYNPWPDATHGISTASSQPSQDAASLAANSLPAASLKDHSALHAGKQPAAALPAASAQRSKSERPANRDSSTVLVAQDGERKLR